MRRRPEILDQPLDDRLGLLEIGGADIDDVGECRVAQELGPGERRDERHARLACDRLGRGRGRRTDLADQREDLVFPDQRLGIGDRRLRFVAVVAGNKVEMPAVDAAGRVGLGEGGGDAAAHLDAELRGRPGEGRRLPEQDAVGADARPRPPHASYGGEGEHRGKERNRNACVQACPPRFDDFPARGLAGKRARTQCRSTPLHQ